MTNTIVEVRPADLLAYELQRVLALRRENAMLREENADLLRIAAIYHHRHGSINITRAEYETARGAEVTTREERDAEGGVLYRVEVKC